MNGICWIIIGLLVIALGNWFIVIGNLKISKTSEENIIGQTKKSEDHLSNKLKGIQNSVDALSQTITPQNFKEYYNQAKFIYNAATHYQNMNMNLEAANGFLLFRDLCVKSGAIQAAAISSLIAAFRFEDVKDFSKAGELQSDAGDFYIKLNDISEAKLWKMKAIENYKKAGIVDKANCIENEIKNIK